MPKKQKLTPAQRKIAEDFLLAIRDIRNDLTVEDKEALDELENGKYKPIFEDRGAGL